MKRQRSPALGLATGLLLSLAAGAAAEEARQVKLPETAEEYVSAASEYEQKAKVYAEEAAYHRAMVKAAYKAELHSKAPIRRAYEKMRKHCEPIIRDAERLANDMDAFATFYRVRAMELKGQ